MKGKGNRVILTRPIISQLRLKKKKKRRTCMSNQAYSSASDVKEKRKREEGNKVGLTKLIISQPRSNKKKDEKRHT
jgi:hypothetical protein